MSFFKKVNYVNPRRTICEVHREMYDLIRPLQEVIKIDGFIALLEEANTMAKKMSNKLYEYHYNVAIESEVNENYEASKELRKDRDVHSK
jgi:hypothetical protein